MSFNNYTERMEQLDRLISKKMTGTPRACADKLGISERALYDMIGHMREIFQSPISYCRDRQTYFYTQPGRLYLKFRPEE